MKLRGAWGNAVKFISLATLLCGVVLWTVNTGAGKRELISSNKDQIAEASRSKPVTAQETQRWAAAYGKLPLSFEENQGQTAREVRYLSHGPGYEVFLTSQEAVLALRPNKRYDLTPLHRAASLRAIGEARKAALLTAVRLRLEGANPEPQITGMNALEGKSNYFIGNDPKNWHTDVRSYARVKYAGVYPGVDLVFYGNQRRLEYDFVVAPGADPKAIQLKVDGAQKMRVNSRGDLVLSVAGGEVTLQKPLIYQQVNDEKREIAGNYILAGNHRVAFSVADYNRREPLILDPVLNYSTYLGGSASEDFSSAGPAAAIAVDSSGDAFVTGQTTSVNFPTGTNGGVPLAGSGTVTAPNPNSGAVYVAELDPTGTKLLYSTYLAGTTTAAGDSGFGIAVDSSGKVYVTGLTFAIDFPTTSNALNPGPLASNTLGTAFVTKLDPTVSGKSSLLYSTFLGGTGGDSGNAIAVDSAGNAYVSGMTNSTNFPTKNPFQSAPAAGNTIDTAFLTRVDTTQSGTNSLIYSTYLGGNGANSGLIPGDVAFGVAVDSAKIAYVSGSTSSTNFPTTSGTAYLSTLPAGHVNDAVFLSKIDTTATSSSLVYSTYLAGLAGSAGDDVSIAIALGPNNVAYVTGLTNSSDFPTTTGAFQTTGANKAFVSLVDTTLSHTASLKYSTYLGGSGTETGFGIKADASGNAYVAGTSTSPDFGGAGTLKALGAFQPTLSNSHGDAFIAKLNPAGGGASDLLYATYFGGSNGATADQGLGIGIDTSTPPNAYITGETASSNVPTFPTTTPTAFQTALSGPMDAFIAKLSLIPTLSIVPAPGSTIDFGTVQTGTTSAAKTVTMTNNTSATISFTSAVLSGTNMADYAVTTSGCTGGIAVGTPCVVSITFKPTIVAPPSEVATLTITDGDSTSPQVYSLTGKGSSTPPPPDFTLSASTTAETVAQGAVGAPITITVNPLNGFNSAVALTCTGTPANSSCVLSPTSITPPTTSKLTFTAHAMLVPVPVSRPTPPPFNLLRIVPLFVALMLIFLLRSTQRLRTRVAMVTAILFCVTLAACSGAGGPAKTAKGAYQLTITGTSGTLSHTVTPVVTITVN